MTNGPSTESDAVTAFIRERQSAVRADAIDQLGSCSVADLPEVVHAVFGTVGSYQLDAEHAAISQLATVLSDPESTGADIEAARGSTLDALRRLETERTT